MPVAKPKKVTVHPIVLLSVVDHFNRMKKISNQRRVVGVLLGSWYHGAVDVATSFAGKSRHCPRVPLRIYGIFSAYNIIFCNLSRITDSLSGNHIVDLFFVSCVWDWYACTHTLCLCGFL